MMYRLAALLPVLLLAACASQPTNYYRLAAQDAQSTPAVSGSARSQVVVSVNLPDYLNTANIAYQNSDVEISLAQNNLWAEAPEPAIARLLVNDLSKRLPQTAWLTGSTAASYRGTTILVALDQFNGRHDGHAVISGQWLIRDSNQQLLGAYPINIEVTQYGNGYDALVRALNQGVHQLSAQIGSQLPPSAIRP